MPYTLSFDHIPKRDHLTLPDLPKDTFNAWHGFQIDLGLTTAHLSLAKNEHEALPAIRTSILKLSSEATQPPDLEPALPPASSKVEEVPDVGPQEELQPHQQDDEDIWATTDIHKPRRKTDLLGWDCFKNEGHQEPLHTYISEAGNAVFDVLMTRSTSNERQVTKNRYAQSNILLNALLDLGLGRKSAFFRWEEGDKSFKSAIPNIAVTGFSEQLLSQVIDTCLERGTRFIAAQRCVEYLSKQGSVQVALGSAITTMLDAIKGHVESRWHQTATILQLQELCRRPDSILQLLSRVGDAIHSKNDVTRLIALIASWTAEVSLKIPLFEPVASRVFFRTIEPELQQLRSQIGLVKDNSHKQPFSNNLDLPLSEKLNALIRSSTESLHVLRVVSLEDSVIHASLANNQLLSVRTSWYGILDAQRSADRYEQDALKTLRLDDTGERLVSNAHDSGLHIAAPAPLRPSSTTSPFALDLQMFRSSDLHLDTTQMSQADGLREAVECFLADQSTLPIIPPVPHQQALELSITPILTAQHRLLSYRVLHLLFEDYKVFTHLNALYRFQLLADGAFASRLSMALFDTEQISGEGARATNATTGLRLQSRETWPPAGTELRLVLLDILSESIVSMDDRTLDESISFAIRDLSDEELERCRDVNSIYALDFLRIFYKPHHLVLEGVITSTVLAKYDRIFMYLLRLLRLKDLAQHILRRACARPSTTTAIKTPGRTNHKFSLAIQQFISTIANHSHLVITTTWTRFESILTKIQSRLAANDYQGTLSSVGSLDQLRQMHEDTLDGILEALLLKQRQVKIRTVLEDIFGVILKFASVTSDAHPHPHHGASSDQVYKLFDVKVVQFVQLLRQAIDTNPDAGSGAGDRHRQAADRALLESLLLSVDFNSYYSKKSGGLTATNERIGKR